MNYKLGICVNRVPRGTLVQVSPKAVFHAVSWSSQIPQASRLAKTTLSDDHSRATISSQRSAFLGEGNRRPLHPPSSFSSWTCCLLLAAPTSVGAFTRGPFLHFLEGVNGLTVLLLFHLVSLSLSCPGGRWILLWVPYGADLTKSLNSKYGPWNSPLPL